MGQGCLWEGPIGPAKTLNFWSRFLSRMNLGTESADLHSHGSSKLAPVGETHKYTRQFRGRDSFTGSSSRELTSKVETQTHL